MYINNAAVSHEHTFLDFSINCRNGDQYIPGLWLSEELLWAVKNGDVDTAKKYLEMLSTYTCAEGGRR